MIPECRLGHMAKAVGIEISSGSGNDPRTLQHLAAEHPAIERWQQLAPCEIASATKNHKIERIDRNDSRNHDQSTSNRFNRHGWRAQRPVAVVTTVRVTFPRNRANLQALFCAYSFVPTIPRANGGIERNIPASPTVQVAMAVKSHVSTVGLPRLGKR